MTKETCTSGSIALPTALQQTYDQLSSPQCTNYTYMQAFVSKMLVHTVNDGDMRNIVCHLTDAIYNLNLIHVRKHITVCYM